MSSVTPAARRERRAATHSDRVVRDHQCHQARSVVRGAGVRDADGRLRRVTGTARPDSAARARLRQRLLERPAFGTGGLLDLTSSFRDLVELWLEDLALQKLSGATKENYRDDLRLHVLPQFEHFTLGEITTGRVEWFLRSEAAVSFSRAKHSRTMLNLLFGFALRHDAIPRNPVQGTSPLRRPKGEPQALTVDQITAIRDAVSRWRTGPDVKEPKPDGQVRDIIEVLLGTVLRIGECLALRLCDVEDSPDLRDGTVVLRTGSGAVRQDHPKTEHSIRRITVPDSAACPSSTARRHLDHRPATHHLRRSSRQAAEPAQRSAHLSCLSRVGRSRGGGDHPSLASAHRRDSHRARCERGRCRHLPRPRLDRDHGGALHRARPHRGPGAGRDPRTDSAPRDPQYLAARDRGMELPTILRLTSSTRRTSRWRDG